MTHTHRTMHRLLWPLLAITIVALFAVALIKRTPPEGAPAAPAAEHSR
jgi:hypothetical protein